MTVRKQIFGYHIAVDFTIIWLAAFACLVAGLFVVRRRLLAGASLPDAAITELRELLLDGIKESSPEEGTRVDISEFWRETKVSPADRFRILEPLLERGILRGYQKDDPAARSVEWLRKYFFLGVPYELILSGRDWRRMVHGEPAITIIGEQRIDNSQRNVTNNIQKNSGYIGAVSVGGEKSTARMRDMKGGDELLSSDHVARMIEALRSDARASDNPAQATELHAVANELEKEDSSEHRSQEKLMEVFDSIKKFSVFSSEGLGATKAVLEMLKNVIN